MKHPRFTAISAGLLGLLAASVAYDAHAAQSPLVVRVTRWGGLMSASRCATLRAL